MWFKGVKPRANLVLLGFFYLSYLSGCSSCAVSTKLEISQTAEPPKSVTGYMQTRIGGPLEQTEVAVHEVPTDLPIVKAHQANLGDNDLVLGVVKAGRAVAFPVRFLAMYEVVDSKVGKIPVAPTW